MTDRRRYQSSLRAERAEDTRRRIRASASNLFTSDGFGATTIAAIADAAGVSPQTVYSVFGSKGGIVRSMLEELEQSADEASLAARIAAEPDARRQLRLFVAFNRTLFENGAPIVRAVLAARSDPDVAAVKEQGDQNRREGSRHLVAALQQKGALRRRLKPADAADRLWMLTSAEQYLHAIDGLGWAPERYERWLGELLERELLEPER